MRDDRDRHYSSRLVSFLTLAIVAGIVKTLGGVLYSSRAVLVDAATSIANIMSVIVIIYYLRESLKPPDTDHLYGHFRLALGGEFFTILIYSFVAGLMILDLASGFEESYRVDLRASIYSSIGMTLYIGAISLGRRLGESFKTYVNLTYIEIIEGVTAILASLAGALISYIIDLAGGCALYIYLVREIFFSSIRFIRDISDEVESEVVEKTMRIVNDLGLELKSVRLRRFYKKLYYGEMIIAMRGDRSVEEAHRIVDQLEKRLMKENIYISIHVEPSDSHI
ncbi:MAG: cation transporter [Sulfolobales archaeon]